MLTVCCYRWVVTEVAATGARADTRATIVGAAARLLREQGMAGVTTRAVAHAADVQAPTIYRLFGDKDGLLDAVAEHVMQTYVAAKPDGLGAPDADLGADLRSGWLRHVAFGLANAELYVLLNAQTRSRQSPAIGAGQRVLRARMHRLAAAGMLRVDEQRATEMFHAAGNGTILAILSKPAHERDPAFEKSMFDSVARAILLDVPAPSGSGTAALTIAFATVVPHLATLTDAERALMTEWLTRAVTDLQNS